MEWWDSLVEGVGNLFDSDSGNSWIERNWDTISGVADKGRQAYNLWDANNARQGSRGDILDMLYKQEAQDNAYAQQMWQYQNAQRAAAAASARAYDAARRKAAGKAFKKQSKMLKQLISQYQPYNDAVQQLTPKMADNYSQYLDTTALLNQYLTPKVMQTLGSAPKASYEINVPRNSFSVPVAQSPEVRFPTMEEIQKRS